MMRFIMPVVLIGIAISIFFLYTNHLYNDIPTLKTEVASYDAALNNSKALEIERDNLTTKYNTIDPDNLTKLTKLLPENVDNIRLILEIEKIALPYGMALADVTYNATDTSTVAVTTASVVVGGGVAGTVAKDYGIFDLAFSTTGSYDNFLNFTKDLESNLRIVDISSITFSSDTNTGPGLTTGLSTPETYKYNFKIRTYWLKN